MNKATVTFNDGSTETVENAADWSVKEDGTLVVSDMSGGGLVVHARSWSSVRLDLGPVQIKACGHVDVRDVMEMP